MRNEEQKEQIALIKFCRKSTYTDLRKIFAIPNGGKRNMVTAVNMKREGVLAGVPDLFLPVPRGQYHGLFIEMKKAKGGVVSPKQKEKLKELNEDGYKAVVCNGYVEAMDVLLEYIRC